MNFYQRALVITYGMAILALGFYPLEHKHGGTVNYLKQQTQTILNRKWVPESWKQGNKIEVTSKKEEAAKAETAKLDVSSKGSHEAAEQNREDLKKFFDSIATRD